MRAKYYLCVFVAIVAALLFTSVPLCASEAPIKIKVSGEIDSIDIKQGELQLDKDALQDSRHPTKYRINRNDTRVTDPTDTKFLKLEDLREGQHVIIEFNYVREKQDRIPIIQKIIANPTTKPGFQEATGELEAIDVRDGTLIIEEKPLPGEGKGNLSYFVFDEDDIIMMKTPSAQPVELDLKPGDLVRVEFVVKDGRRYAHSITLLRTALETTSTTTTTTTSTTVTR